MFQANSLLRCIICVAALTVLFGITTSAQASTIFSDDFEDGTWDKWTIGGRQTGTWSADVVNQYGSRMGHLYKYLFTEVEATSQKFDYDPDLTFSFDMELTASGGFNQYYGMAYARISFYNGSDEELGNTRYYFATTNHVISGPTRIPVDTGLHSYSLLVADILANHDTFSVEEVNSVELTFGAYCSGSIYTRTANVWVDNVVVSVVPEPTALGLLMTGCLVFSGCAMLHRGRKA